MPDAAPVLPAVKPHCELQITCFALVAAPRRCLDNAVMVFTSTRQEVDEQWGL